MGSTVLSVYSIYNIEPHENWLSSCNKTLESDSGSCCNKKKYKPHYPVVSSIWASQPLRRKQTFTIFILAGCLELGAPFYWCNYVTKKHKVQYVKEYARYTS